VLSLYTLNESCVTSTPNRPLLVMNLALLLDGCCSGDKRGAASEEGGEAGDGGSTVDSRALSASEDIPG
jgi:hypothetical protein